jgi:hypothetical protein
MSWCVGACHTCLLSVCSSRAGCSCTATLPIRAGGHTMCVTRPSSSPRCTCSTPGSATTVGVMQQQGMDSFT